MRKPRFTIGYTTRRHLILDLDNTTTRKVEHLANQIQEMAPEVGNILILLSSTQTLQQSIRYSKYNKPRIRVRRNNYHIICDNAIGYNRCVQIIKTLAGLGILNRDYTKIREWRGDMTLRVSPSPMSDKDKPIPAVVSFIKNRHSPRADGYIWQYLTFLNVVRTIFRQSSSPKYYTLDDLQQQRKSLQQRLQQSNTKSH